MPLPVRLLLLIALSFSNVELEVRAAELTDKAGCSVRRELLNVVCQALNGSALTLELQHKLADPVPAGEYSSSPWVHELKVFDGRVPVLATVVPKNVPALGGLKLLEVVRCQIRQVRIEAMMEVAGSLRFLSLAHNKLVSIPAALSVLDKLEVLDLRHNAITRLTPLLARLTNLRHLKLDHNRIRQVTGWGSSPKAPQLSSLTHLGLTNNLIHEVWDEALSGLHALQNLDLSNNLLQRLSRTLDFPPRLMEFDIRENPWHCDCGAAWLANLHSKTDPNALLTFLPTCSSPQYLRSQPLASLSAFELCSGWANVNGTRSKPRDIDNHHMQVSKVEATSFELTWNVSGISQRGKKIQEYLGWRVTFRKFAEDDESEVLLITLAGEEAERKTGTSSGRYTVRHLTPATGYMVCFQTLTDNEINNIIESQKVNRVTPFPDSSPEPKGRSLELEGSQSPNDFFDEWGSVLADELITSTPAVETTTVPETTDPITEEEYFTTENDEISVIQPQRFVYTNTGDRIPINFGSSGSPTHPAFPGFNHPSFASFNEYPSSTNNEPPIRNVPPPPPPPNFDNSDQKFPFPFIRKKRSLAVPSAPPKGRCVEVTTEEEDEITMPVTVAATASSSTTMVILMICCCCFPKKCNRMRDCCINKCKSMRNQTLIKTTSKTKTFVRPPKTEEKKMLSKSISLSTPNLRIMGSYENISEYQYHKLNKYYTMRGKELDKAVIQFFPGYDLPKTAAAKYFGYDFPKIQNVSEVYSKMNPNYVRRLSTDDNTSPVDSDRFIYSNLNRAQTNLNIPIDQCKYSNRIKGISYSPVPEKFPQPLDYEHYKKPKPMYITPKKVLNNNDGFSTVTLKRSKLLLPRSQSTPDLKATFTSDNPNMRIFHNILSPVTSNEDKICLQNNPAYDLPIQIGNPAEKSQGNSKPKLEVVRQFVQPTPKRPSLLNISEIQNYAESLNGHVAHPSLDQNEYLYYPKPKPPRPDTSKDTMQLYQLPRRSESKPATLPHSQNTRALPVGEVAVTGGTLIEVPEGYVFPNKPRPINVLRLKVPADPASFSET